MILHWSAGLTPRTDKAPRFRWWASAPRPGMEAFEQFFTGRPPDTGMAFVLVQHLSPPYKSILPEIIQRFTAIPVTQVTDGIPMEPNRVYVIPPS